MTPHDVNGPGALPPDPATAAELERLRAEVASLRARLARAEQERDIYCEELDRVIKSSHPFPPTEEEIEAMLRGPMVGSNELAALIAELEAQEEQA